MNIIYTNQALADLEEIYAYQSKQWPDSRRGFAERLSQIEKHIAIFPLGLA